MVIDLEAVDLEAVVAYCHSSPQIMFTSLRDGHSMSPIGYLLRQSTSLQVISLRIATRVNGECLGLHQHPAET